MFWNVRFDTAYIFAPKLKKHYVSMIIPALTGLLVVGILTAFFYKTTKMGIAGAIIAALVFTGVVALLVIGAIFASDLFRDFQ